MVENNGSVTFFVFLCFSHNIANLGFDKTETVVKPGLDELFELLFLNIGVFDDVLFFEKVLVVAVAHIDDAYHFEVVLIFDFC